MSLLEQTIKSIPEFDQVAQAAVSKTLDGKTKPRKSLGRLEALAVQFAGIQSNSDVKIPSKAIVVMAGDHGVAANNVSAYPQSVTGQMLLNFASGGAAVNVLARHVGAELVVVNMGTIEPLPEQETIQDKRIGPGTKDFTAGPAMTVEETTQALETGIIIANQLAEKKVGLIGLGEMGIGNTTIASALTAAFLGKSPEDVTGYGTGIDQEGKSKKVIAIQKALEVNKSQLDQPLKTLAALGGFETAGLAGVVIGAAAKRIPVLLDGFIATAAALAAVKIAPKSRYALIASHKSVEPGHICILEELKQEPFLDLQMRLGEGTGAALAMTMVDAAIKIFQEMASFESAGVDDTGA